MLWIEGLTRINRFQIVFSRIIRNNESPYLFILDEIAERMQEVLGFLSTYIQLLQQSGVFQWIFDEVWMLLTSLIYTLMFVFHPLYWLSVFKDFNASFVFIVALIYLWDTVSLPGQDTTIFLCCRCCVKYAGINTVFSCSVDTLFLILIRIDAYLCYNLGKQYLTTYMKQDHVTEVVAFHDLHISLFFFLILVLSLKLCIRYIRPRIG